MKEKVEMLNKLIKTSKKIVFFGGAGVSTESGLPDFRGTGGIFQTNDAYPPEEILSRDFFFSHTEEFYRFYREKMAIDTVAPNITHQKLAELEAAGKLFAVVTQNIDGLHQAAGSKRVYELHGSIHRNHCLSCGHSYSLREILAQAGVPRCSCGSIIKPDVVLYGENLPEDTLAGAIVAISQADLLIVGGTSLCVYPAAGLLRHYGGRELVLINKAPTPMDGEASLLFSCGLGEVFGRIEI